MPQLKKSTPRDKGYKPRKYAPRNINSEMIEAVASAIKNGLTLQLAAGAAGVSVSSIYRWIAEGEEVMARADETNKAPEPHRLAVVEFALAVRAAQHEHASGAMAGLMEEGPGAWQKFAWILERRYGYRMGVDVDQTTNSTGSGDVASALAIIQQLRDGDVTDDKGAGKNDGSSPKSDNGSKFGHGLRVE